MLIFGLSCSVGDTGANIWCRYSIHIKKALLNVLQWNYNFPRAFLKDSYSVKEGFPLCVINQLLYL